MWILLIVYMIITLLAWYLIRTMLILDDDEPELSYLAFIAIPIIHLLTVVAVVVYLLSQKDYDEFLKKIFLLK